MMNTTTTTQNDATLSLGTQLLTPRLLLRLEGTALFAAATAAYFVLGGSAGWFFGLFFLPDVALLPYLIGPRVGAFTYNLAHTTTLALALGAVAVAVGSMPVTLGALVWLAHIGFDRALGYGLKHAGSFKDTHIQRA
jgi:hypothetical protein